MARVDRLLYLPPMNYPDLYQANRDVHEKIASAPPNLEPSETNLILTVPSFRVKNSLGKIGLQLKAQFERLPGKPNALRRAELSTFEAGIGPSTFSYRANEGNAWLHTAPGFPISVRSTNDVVASVCSRISNRRATEYLYDSPVETSPDHFIGCIVADTQDDSQLKTKTTHLIPNHHTFDNDREVSFATTSNKGRPDRLTLSVGETYTTGPTGTTVHKLLSFRSGLKDKGEASETLRSTQLSARHLHQLIDPNDPGAFNSLKRAGEDFKAYIAFTHLAFQLADLQIPSS